MGSDKKKKKKSKGGGKGKHKKHEPKSGSASNSKKKPHHKKKKSKGIGLVGKDSLKRRSKHHKSGGGGGGVGLVGGGKHKPKNKKKHHSRGPSSAPPTSNRSHRKKKSRAKDGGSKRRHPKSKGPPKRKPDLAAGDAVVVPMDTKTTSAEKTDTTATSQVIQTSGLPSPSSQPTKNNSSTVDYGKAPPIPKPDDDKTIREPVGQPNYPSTEREKCQSDKLKNYVEKILNDGLDGIATEFRNTRMYLPQAATRMDFDENEDKNRFQDMVCVDQTRVQLDNVDNDYIHANWVQTGDTKKAILTQLPLPNTAADFWEMVLQNNVQAILLILSQFEYRTFCPVGVFPEKGDFIHFPNHLKVGDMRRVEISKNWTIRVLSVKHQERQKYVHLHHYTDWKHGRPPGDVAEIWQIQSTFRKYEHPHVYMSLSGGGRAGTYAAFESAHSRMHNENFIRINVADCITKVRNSRMHAVQSPSQMQFIHIAILDHIFAIPEVSLIIPRFSDQQAKFQSMVTKFRSRKTSKLPKEPTSR